jgi:class 3 adenylate cyclase
MEFTTMPDYAVPDYAVEHPSLLPKEQQYLRIERTFIFVDLSGFTAFTREHGADRAAGVLTYFRYVTRSVASQRGVRVAKWLGDGAMLVGVEPSPSVALGAHLITQLGTIGTTLRIGIATGVALLFEGDDYIGEPVNLAARLCTAARPGEVLAACSRADLPYWVDVAGTHSIELKGIGTVTDVLRLQPATR